jgi:hypothetical protein
MTRQVLDQLEKETREEALLREINSDTPKSKSRRKDFIYGNCSTEEK